MVEAPRSIHDTNSAPGPLPAPVSEPRSSAAADKLYVLTRADLSPGYQAVQAGHAIADWTAEHPQDAAGWRTTSNSLIVLTAADEQALYALIAKAERRNIPLTCFREPDLGDEITAVALTPGDLTRKLCSNQPLVGRRCDDAAAVVAAKNALARERRLRETSYAMMGCEQTPGQDVLAHGRSVREHYRVLRAHLLGQLDLHQAPNWRLPAWVDTYAEQLSAHAGDPWIVDRYLTMHDCGKPRVATLDDQGRRRFPGHAEASARAYLDTYLGEHTGPEGPADAGRGRDQHEQVADLIAHDMDIHLLKAAGVERFCANPHAVIHLLAGLAEVTANAAMFGGIDSTSFKIKYKQLNSRGNAICARLFDTNGQEAPQ